MNPLFTKVVKGSVLSLVRAICILIVAIGLFAGVLGTSLLIAMLLVWFREPFLQPEDEKIVAWASLWTIGAASAVVFSWWLRSRTFPEGHPARRLRLVSSSSELTEQMVHNWSELGLLAVAAVWIWGSCLAGIGSKLIILVGSLIALYLAMHGRILVHELGHLIAAKAVGLNRRRLQVGAGPLIWSRLFRSGFLFEWRIFARGGWVLALPASEKNLRIRQLLFIGAGPVIDFVLICALCFGLTKLCGSLTAAFTYGVTGIIVFMLFWWTVISAVSGLIPHRVNIGGRKLWTDGYWILLLCTASIRRIKDAIRGFDSQMALEFLRANSIPLPAIDGQNGRNPDAAPAIQQFHQQRTRLAARLRPKLTA